MNEIVKVIQVDTSSVQDYVNTLKDANTEVSELTSTTQSYNNVAGELDVKDYASGFKNLSVSGKDAYGSVKTLTGGFKALKASAGWIGAIVTVLLALANQVKKSEAATASFKRLFATLEPIFNAISRVVEKVLVKTFDTLVNIISKVEGMIGKIAGKLGDWVGALADMIAKVPKMGKVADSIRNAANAMKQFSDNTEQGNTAMQNQISLTERENALLEKRRQTAEREAKIDAEIAELREKISDSNISDAEKTKAAEQWKQLEQERYDLTKQLLSEELAIANIKKQQSASSQEDLDHISDLNVQLTNLDTNFNNALRQINRSTKSIKGDLQESVDYMGDLTSKYDDYSKNLGKVNTPDIKEFEQTFNDVYNIFQDNINRNAKEGQNTLFWSLLGVEDAEEAATKTYEVTRATLEANIAAGQAILDSDTLLATERVKVQEWLYDQQEKLRQTDAQREQDIQDNAAKEFQAIQQAKINSLFQLANATGEVFTQIADMQEQGSEEQKAYAIMGATINTIATGVSAVRSIWQSAPNPIIAAIQTAATVPPLVAGLVAQIKQIKGTKKGSDSVGSVGSNLSGIKTSPLLNKETDLTAISTINVSKDKEATRVYVLESDISDAVKHQNVKVEESSW